MKLKNKRSPSPLTIIFIYTSIICPILLLLPLLEASRLFSSPAHQIHSAFNLSFWRIHLLPLLLHSLLNYSHDIAWLLCTSAPFSCNSKFSCLVLHFNRPYQSLDTAQIVPFLFVFFMARPILVNVFHLCASLKKHVVQSS